jgi:DNA-binding CsgD family transcriptional regulator/catechol 2,3-dioxygenase-like lactoylglutathione lyase family enzyme
MLSQKGEGNSAFPRLVSGPMARGRPAHPDVLTPAEWRVVNAVRHGMSNPQISNRLNVSLYAVKFHVANAVVKLGLRNRTALKHWFGAPVGSAVKKGHAMNSPTVASTTFGSVGQISRMVRDIPRAVEWYRDVLGLAHLFTFGDLAFFDCQGLRLYLNKAENGGDLRDSVIYFRVNDIHAEVERLHAKGVVFKGAPHMIHKHPDGTEEWMTFFKDVDGQLLALMSQVNR